VSSPINMNQSVLQSVISERVQQVQQQHPDMQQRYFEHQLSRERIKKQHKVNEFKEIDYIKLKDKEERKQGKDQPTGRDDEGVIPETETAVGTDQPTRINIKA